MQIKKVMIKINHKSAKELENLNMKQTKGIQIYKKKRKF